jgi:hypothetical protein
MILGLTGCAVSLDSLEKLKEELKNGASVENIFNWGTPHCIISLILIVIIFIHVWQHLPLLKTIIAKNLYLKNKLTTVIGVLFILTVVSVFLYLFGFTSNKIHFHSLIVHIFLLIVVIHLILNFKKLINLFQNNK